tara:strand:- start:1226 stop:1465 length:240 start_codon:yes stop_codon:yes gene_type:complete
MKKQNLQLFVFGITLFLIVLYFYNKKNDEDKDIIEGFSFFSSLWTIIKFPFYILKAILFPISLICKLIGFLEKIINKFT